MACASLAMYDMLAPVSRGNDTLWHFVRDRLRDAGFAAPEELERQSSHDALWPQPDLILAQTCGYPYITQLKGKVRLVATPIYQFAGGRGTERLSYVVVSVASSYRTLADLRGKTVALNDRGSNSGMNLLRAAVAPLAQDGHFFSDVLVTGGHHASLAAVAAGHADVAAVDTVTFGLLQRHAPESLAGIRVLQSTDSGPGLPLITSLNASDEMVGVLRKALSEAVATSSLGLADDLGMIGIEYLTDSDYARLDNYRLQAEKLGYPVIA